MAVVKGIENVYGAEFSYHAIQSVSIMRIQNELQLRIVVASWINKEARKEGKKPVLTENIIQNADFALEPFYALLKAKFEDYSGADDDWEVVSGKKQLPAVYTQQTPAGEIISRHEEKDQEEAEPLDEAAKGE